MGVWRLWLLLERRRSFEKEERPLWMVKPEDGLEPWCKSREDE